MSVLVISSSGYVSSMAGYVSSLPGSLPGALPAACPVALPGVGPALGKIEGWTAWTFIALMSLAGVFGVIMFLWGKVGHHPKGARLGIEVLLTVVGAAVLYVVFPGIPSAIAAGCTGAAN